MSARISAFSFLQAARISELASAGISGYAEDSLVTAFMLVHQGPPPQPSAVKSSTGK